jgi:non-homologous end joining protein Ku
VPRRKREGLGKELELGIGLIGRLTSEEFHPDNYKDDYRIRMLVMVDEKSKVKEIGIDTEPSFFWLVIVHNCSTVTYPPVRQDPLI